MVVVLEVVIFTLMIIETVKARSLVLFAVNLGILSSTIGHIEAVYIESITATIMKIEIIFVV